MAKDRGQHHHEDLFSKITKKIEFFIVKNLKVIVISISSIIVILTAYFTIDYIIFKNEEKANKAFGRVYLVYRSILNDEEIEEEELINKLININKDFEVVIKDYPNSKASMKSAYYIGNTMYKSGRYEEAIEYYIKGHSGNSKYYVSLLSLLNEASSYEQLGQYENAVQVYEKILNIHDDKFIIPLVLFNLGQIHEKQDKLKKSNNEYSIIVSDYQWSSWKDFAEKKLLLLKNLM